MITIFKSKKTTPYEIITINDTYFNRYTVDILDERAKEIVTRIDESELIDNYTMKSKFNDNLINTDRLSSGCKTALNIMYAKDKIFDLRECGDNALDVIYSLDVGMVYCDYPMISFDMKAVKVYENSCERIISDYSELKEWWQS